MHVSAQLLASPPLTECAVVREAERAAAAKVPTVVATIGEPLKNVNIWAGRGDPIALPEDQYPRWLQREVERPERRDPHLFEKEGRLPTRTELRLIGKAKIRENNMELGA